MNGQDLHELACVFAKAEHRDAGGDGDAPDALVLKFENELSERIGSQETDTLNIPNPRQMPGIGITNGQMPDNETRTARPVSELRTYRTAEGGRVRAFSHGQNICDYNEHRPKFSLEQVGEVLCSMVTGRRRAGLDDELRAMSTGLNVGGGFLIDETLSTMVIDAARPKSRVLAAGAQVVEVPGDSLRIARLSSDPTMGIVGENQAIDFSDAAFDAIWLRPRKIGVIVPCSVELLDDAPNAGAILMQSLTNAMAAKIDDLALNGTGTGGSFLGLLSDPQIHETGSIGGLTYDDLLTAQLAVRTLNGEPNAMIAHPKALNALALLRDVPTGSYLAPPPALANIAMMDTTRCPDTALVLGDYSQVLMGVRTDLTITTSSEAGDSFQKHQVYIKAVMRADMALARPFFERLEGLTY